MDKGIEAMHEELQVLEHAAKRNSRASSMLASVPTRMAFNTCADHKLFHYKNA